MIRTPARALPGAGIHPSDSARRPSCRSCSAGSVSVTFAPSNIDVYLYGRDPSDSQ